MEPDEAERLYRAVSKLSTAAEGAEFMRVYTAGLAAAGVEEPERVARANICGLDGYGSAEEFTRILELTGAR